VVVDLDPLTAWTSRAGCIGNIYIARGARKGSVIFFSATAPTELTNPSLQPRSGFDGAT